MSVFVNPSKMNVQKVEPFSENSGLENNSQDTELSVLQRAVGDIASSSQNELWRVESPFIKTTVEPQEPPLADLWSDWVALLRGHIQDVQRSLHGLRQESLNIGSLNFSGKRLLAQKIQSKFRHLTKQQAALVEAEKILEIVKSNGSSR